MSREYIVTAQINGTAKRKITAVSALEARCEMLDFLKREIGIVKVGEISNLTTCVLFDQEELIEIIINTVRNPSDICWDSVIEACKQAQEAQCE